MPADKLKKRPKTGGVELKCYNGLVYNKLTSYEIHLKDIPDGFIGTNYEDKR